MSITPITAENIIAAHERIKFYLNHTPLLTCEGINQMLGVNVFFKCESFQKTGSFKIRGALNTLLTLKEQNILPAQVCAFSSGNHAQAVAYAAKLLGIKAIIFIPEFGSRFKIDATRALGAEVILTKTRQDAEAGARALQSEGYYFIHPYDNDYVIQGQATACYEALKEMLTPDAVFVPVGGGGLTSGTFLSSHFFSPQSKVYGGEPQLANDASISFRTGSIHTLAESPKTIADGVRTLAVSERTFHYIRQLDDIIEVQEQDIIHWVRIIALHQKIVVEPTSCVAVAACALWAAKPENKGKNALVMLSGGNMDTDTLKRIYG